MPSVAIRNDGQEVEIDYLDEGQGEPVVLVHGFASTKEVNWLDTGWVKALVNAGFRVIAIDNRGHGRSTKFHRQDDYSLDRMADDTVLFLDSLGIARARFVGYSMGARIALTIAMRHPERVVRLVLSGNGWNMVEGTGDWTSVREALLAPTLDSVTDRRGRAFRIFADHTRSDRVALAACVTGVRQRIPSEELHRVRAPTLVAVGTEDDIAGSGQRLADALPSGRFLAIEGRDHMRAVGDRHHVREAVNFLRDPL